MCMCTMESILDARDGNDIQPAEDVDWLNKYVETENIFLDYLRSITFASLNGELSSEAVLPQYDGSEPGLEALDHLCDLLVTLCDGNGHQNDEGFSNAFSSDGERKKHVPRSKRSLRCLSSHYGKELQVKPNRARSHSSVGVDEILRGHELVDINAAAESRRKSRRVSLGMRPKFSNWSKVKGAFKRDKSNSRLDSRDGEYADYSGDEGAEKGESQFSSSHENIGQITSSDEEFEYIVDVFPTKKDQTTDAEDDNSQRTDSMDSRRGRRSSPEKCISKSKSAIIHSHTSKAYNSPNLNNPLHKNPFKWYRTKSIAPIGAENGPVDCLSTPSSPHKHSRFLYDDDAITRVNDTDPTQSGSESASNEVLQEVQNKYESLQKRLSREFHEKYHHDRKRNRDHNVQPENHSTEEKVDIDFDDPKIYAFLAEQNLSPGFKQKFQEWQKLKDGGSSIGSPRTSKSKGDLHATAAAPLKKSKSDWHKWRPGSKSESNVLRFLDKELGLGVHHREIVDGMNSYGDLEEHGGYLAATRVAKKPQTVDLLKGGKDAGQPVEKKELAWLEKELQKVAREKQRLEKEKEKYAERETSEAPLETGQSIERLHLQQREEKMLRRISCRVELLKASRTKKLLRNMKRAIKSGRKRKREVLVPTSTGLFRFQGISSKFTRKLYEWEKAKGITAESSTFTLLDSFYGDPEKQRNNKLQNSDSTTILSRSRSVGSVEVTGVGNSMLQSSSSGHQQSSLSLNDMEQLEEAQLQVENDTLMRSNSQLFDKDNDFDLISTESLVIPDYEKDDSSHSIPIQSSSIKSPKSHESNLNDYSHEDLESERLLESYDSAAENSYPPYHSDTTSEISSSREQRNSANADAESIVDQIKKLRAGTSVDDEDRLNVLNNLERLADQLLDMVRNTSNKKNENVDDLTVKIAELAVALKKEIKILTSDEFQTNYPSAEALPSNEKSAKNFDNRFAFGGEDLYSDIEDNESPTVHCTFTLPSWRVKCTTPSSTESESSNTRNKYLEGRASKNERLRKHLYKEDNSSGGDENYDGSDETTLYLDLRPVKGKERRESSDNISTSNSESIVGTGRRKYDKTTASPSPEPPDRVLQHDNEDVFHWSLTIDGEKPEVRQNHNKAKKLGASHAEERKPRSGHENVELEKQPSIEYEVEDPQPLKMEIRSYSPKPITSKRKCSLCGKVKRISKSRKILSSSTCPCGRREFEKPSDLEPDRKNSAVTKSATSLAAENDHDFQKSASYSNADEMMSRKMGKLFRSKVYDFKALQDSPAVSPTKATGKPPDASSINVIVPTTRKIFAPLKQDENGGASAVVSYTIDESEDGRGGGCDKESSKRNTRSTDEPLKATPLELQARIDKLPPASPLSTKRNFAKDNNSSIKMMIAHYNKLMSENAAKRSEAANCWSPTLQKSPVQERRNQFEHMKNNSQSTIRKSKSAVLSTKATSKLVESPAEKVKHENSQFAIAKCSSAGSLQYRAESFGSLKDCEPIPVTLVSSEEKVHQVLVEKTESKPPVAPSATPTDEDIRHPLNPAISNTMLPLERNSSFESILSETKLRNLRLQEAKKKFFDEHPSTKKVEDLPPEEEQEVSSRSRNLQVENKYELEKVKSLGAESNFGSALNKSVSTGAIDDRRNCAVASSPSGEKAAKSKFGFSSIASKFRKVKMRRHKEPEVSAISSLCRASLLMNLEKEGKSKDYLNGSKSCPSSPVMQRNMSKRNSSSN